MDGFAGPGEYLNYPTDSPLAALSADEETLALTASEWVAHKIHCAFIEATIIRSHLTVVTEVKVFGS